MIICSLSETGESPAVLGDNQEVRGGHWVDVPEGKGQVVLIDDRRWDLLLHNLVKLRDFRPPRLLGFSYLTFNIFSIIYYTQT